MIKLQGGAPDPAVNPAVGRVLVIDADPRSAPLTSALVRAAWPESLSIAQVLSIRDGAAELRERGADCVVVAVSDGAAGLEALHQLRSSDFDAPVILLASTERSGDSVAAIRAGASDQLARATTSPELLRRAVLHAIERRRLQLRLVHQALHDDLTGLPNRSLFLDRLTVALERMRRSTGGVSVLFIDLDNFKEINDTHGHAAGDQVLRIVGSRLRKMLRPSDTVARFGGDEFTFLFEGVENRRDVLALSERIQQVTSMPITLDAGELTVRASIGVASVSEPETPPELVLREADAAMYRAKQDARQARHEPKLVLISSPREPAEPSMLDLRGALERDELRVHYQPKVSLHEREGVLGLEALVRWKHPQRGFVAPSEFIPLAEETGLIGPLGAYVIGDALERLGGWRQVLPGITVSINVSPAQLADGELAPSVAAAIDRAAVDPGALSLEVPERAFSAFPEAAGRVVGELKALGVGVAIDDYGTGSSSLSSLRHLALDALKIDQSFVSALDSSAQPASVVRAVVELGHSLGLRVVAEGVETEAQLAELQSLGCDEAQGFYFCRPVPPEQVDALLSV